MTDAPLFDNDDVQQLFEALVAAYTKQDHASVQHFCVSILALEPDNIDAHFIRGNYLAATGAPKEAIPHLQFTIANAPERIDAYLQLSDAWLGIGVVDQALATLQQGSRQHPNDPRCFSKIGSLYYSAGYDDQALSAFRTALSLDNNHAESCRGMGLSFLRIGLTDAAAEYLKRAVALDPGDLYSIAGLAHCHFNQTAYDEAARLLLPIQQQLQEGDDIVRLLTCLYKLDRKKQFLEVLAATRGILLQNDTHRRSLSFLLCDFNEIGSALDLWHKKLKEAPDNPSHLLELAGLLKYLDQNDLSASYLLKARECCGDDTELLKKIAYSFARSGNTGEAIATFRKLLRLNPNDVAVSHELLQRELSICDFAGYDALVERVRNDVSAAIDEGRCLPFNVFNLQTLPLDYAEISHAAKALAAWFRDDLCKVDEFPAFQQRAPRPAGKPIRIGYLLPYTWFHSLPLVLNELVPLHDRNRFEVYGYCVQPCDGSPFSREYRNRFDRFKDLSFTRPHLSAEQIHSDAIDILIDVTGLTQTNNMHILAYRPAPLQIHAFGYSITTGADYVDYLVTDQTYIPRSQEALNSEKLLYMPDCFLPAGRYNDTAIEMDRKKAGLPEDAIVFANFNEPYKFAPDLAKAWMDILHRVPKAVLWFGAWSDTVQENLRNWAVAEHNIARERLIFAELVPHANHLARLSEADIALDCFRHGGGVTNLDALWCGVPLVTCRGATPSSRLGATLSQAMGIEELTATSIEAYIDIAVALANDPERRARLSQQMHANRTASPLFDIARFCKHFEYGLEAIYALYAAGEAPETIVIPSIDSAESQTANRRGGTVPAEEKALAAISGSP